MGIVYPYYEETVTETTWHYRAAQYLQAVLEFRYRERGDVFVGGNVEEKQSPDVYVCFGARNIDRSSYKTWEEGGIVPQVVFEISSRSSRVHDLGTKKATNEMLGRPKSWPSDPRRQPNFGPRSESVTGQLVPSAFTVPGWTWAWRIACFVFTFPAVPPACRHTARPNWLAWKLCTLGARRERGWQSWSGRTRAA
ncbi:MAG: Uma2 family endonuclease [Candidatus Eremiobacteraeota bacterium]|nr:Uma2 family endonuclease [Candidatus Eremiobacteraeota bacterium]MCW5871872.1 Uma2 family endonuclease [Candidatus Eremiobacteraeota bacterium]